LAAALVRITRESFDLDNRIWGWGWKELKLGMIDVGVEKCM